MATLTRVLFLQTHGLPRNISIQTRSLPAEAHNFRHRCRPRRKWTTCPVLQPEETQLLLDLCRLHHTPPLLTPPLPPLPRASGIAPQNLGLSPTFCISPSSFNSAMHACVCHWFARLLSSDPVLDMLEAVSQCAVDLSVSPADVAHSMWRMVHHSPPMVSSKSMTQA